MVRTPNHGRTEFDFNCGNGRRGNDVQYLEHLRGYRRAMLCYSGGRCFSSDAAFRTGAHANKLTWIAYEKPVECSRAVGPARCEKQTLEIPVERCTGSKPGAWFVTETKMVNETAALSDINHYYGGEQDVSWSPRQLDTPKFSVRPQVTW